MKNIVLFGECMLELKRQSSNQFLKSYAGDAYNTAIYTKRMAPQLNCSFLSASGDDEISQEMLKEMQKEELDTQHIYTVDGKTLGLYMISTDDRGERSFSYWRNDSAAKKTISAMSVSQGKVKLPKCDIFFFSGISLAIMDKSDREAFWHCLSQLRAQGTQIVFDANYRPALWDNIDETKCQYELAFQHSQCVLPGLEDLTAIFGYTDPQTVFEYFTTFNIDRIVLKDGANNVHYQENGDIGIVPITPVRNVIDTTSAGDAFNGGFLAALLSGKSMADAIRIGSRVSAYVIQHTGAIVEKKHFNQEFNKALS